MYVIDLRHYLDDKGDIAPKRGAARRLAEFLTAVVAHESDFDRPDGPGPRCFKCGKHTVETSTDTGGDVVWYCPKCATNGRISHWQGSFWDLGTGLPSD